MPLAALVLSVPLGHFGSIRMICVASTDEARSRPFQRADCFPVVDTPVGIVSDARKTVMIQLDIIVPIENPSQH